VDLDQVVAAELLLRLGERAVRDEPVAVPVADRRRGRRRLERVAGYEHALLPHVLGVRTVRLEDLAALRLVHPSPGLLVVVDQEHAWAGMDEAKRGQIF